jgi:alkylation response protein AidB-like acyl-CoA dehydrogenase
MRFELTDEQDAIRTTARDLLTRRLPSERLRGLLEASSTDDALWAELCDLGWPGLAVAEEHGGQGLGLLELSLLSEELGRALAPVPFLSTAAAGLVLAAAGSADQQARHLPGLAAGTTGGSVARLREGGAVLAIDAAGADVLLLVEDDAAWFAGPGTVVVPSPSIDASRRYASVAPDLGEPLPGSVALALCRVEVLLAAELTGVAQRALELAVAYATERKQFGRPIGSFQGVSHRCARMLLEVETSRALTLYAAWAADAAPAELPLAAAVAKARANEAAKAVTSASMQVHGGIGFTWEADVHLLLKRARASAQLLSDQGELRRRIASLRAERASARVAG